MPSSDRRYSKVIAQSPRRKQTLLESAERFRARFHHRRINSRVAAGKCCPATLLDKCALLRRTEFHQFDPVFGRIGGVLKVVRANGRECPNDSLISTFLGHLFSRVIERPSETAESGERGYHSSDKCAQNNSL